VEVPDSTDLRLPAALSIEFWAKRQRNDTVDLALEKGGDWTGEANYGIGLHSVNNHMFYFFFKGGWRGAPGVADLGWHHYAVTATNGAVDPVLYIDGAPCPVQYSGGAAALNLYPSLRPLHLGAQLSPGWNYYGHNVLDDVRIYNRELTAAEVSYLYHGPPEPKLQVRLASPGLITIEWASITNTIYQLQSATSLPAPSWTNEGASFVGSGGILTTNSSIADTSTKFFRVRVGN